MASSSSLHEPVSVSATESAHLSRQGLLLLSEARAPSLTVWCPTHAERLSYQTGTAAQISVGWRKGSRILLRIRFAEVRELVCQFLLLYKHRVTQEV